MSFIKNNLQIFILLFLFFYIQKANSQSLPIDFETTIVTSNFIDFDGGTATVIANPHSSGSNTSTKVARIVRNGGQVWAGSKIELASNLDFSNLNFIRMKVFTTAPVGTAVKFKLETTGSPGSVERDVQTTLSNAWEVLTWDFTGVPTTFNNLVFMFDFGNVGNGSANSTFFFDDIEQIFGGSQIDYPVDFEDSTVNYTMTDFGGNVSSLVDDPINIGNTIVKVIKTDSAATWAGTTIGTPAGFATNIPFSLTDSKKTIRVWSPDAGIPVRLKVEDSNDPTHTCETEVLTKRAGAWETLVFDFINQAPGTELLSIGLSRGWTYNMASIFFNFGTDGATAGEKTYYFDDVKAGALMLNIQNEELENLNVYPNPSNNHWNVSSENLNITSIEIYNLQGKQLIILNPNKIIEKINATNFAKGIYLAKISTKENVKFIKLIKD